MKTNAKKFFHRGLIFGGFGPIVAAIVYLCISCFEDISLGAPEFFTITVSTYLLAFIHAGASIFNQIEEWHLAKSTGIHFLFLYVAYVLCYIINSWIPFDITIILIFTAIFLAVYLVIWLTVYLITLTTAKRFNQKL